MGERAQVHTFHPVQLQDGRALFTGRTDAEAETPILCPPDENWLIVKDPGAGRDWGQEEKEMTEDKMVGWHHWLDGHEFEWALGDGKGQGGLACHSPWRCKQRDMTERLNNTWNTDLKMVGKHVNYFQLVINNQLGLTIPMFSWSLYLDSDWNSL